MFDNEVKSQNENLFCEEFNISQTILPGGDDYEYKYKNNTLLIIENNKSIYKQEFNKNQISSIDSIIKNINVLSIDSVYSRFVLDGTYWTFMFKSHGIKKEILLSNYYHAKLDTLLRYINRQIPTNKQYVSFGFGYFNDINSKSDTAIYYLPDFYIDTVMLPDTNYNFYRIMCFKKGYFATNILDSISLCDCRIYPTNKDDKKYITRHYWRAWRLDNDNWKREYFDNDNKIFKTDYIKDIIPYKIVKERTFLETGNKPSVTINRYFKTLTIEK